MTQGQWQQAFDRLDRISRARALTDVESLQLERTIHEIDRLQAAPPRPDKWSGALEDKLAALIGDGMSISAAARVLGRTRQSGVAKWKRIRSRYEVAA